MLHACLGNMSIRYFCGQQGKDTNFGKLEYNEFGIKKNKALFTAILLSYVI